MVLTEKDITRFWSKVSRGKKKECWEWLAGKVKNGYGWFNVMSRDYTAHRVAYQIHYGKEPGKFCVLHTCDNPSCCNPYHLFLGTPQQNAADRNRKGREGDPFRTKLSDKQVQEIRELYAAGGVTQTELSVKFGVYQAYISQLVRGKKRKEQWE